MGRNQLLCLVAHYLLTYSLTSNVGLFSTSRLITSRICLQTESDLYEFILTLFVSFGISFISVLVIMC